MDLSSVGRRFRGSLLHLVTMSCLLAAGVGGCVARFRAPPQQVATRPATTAPEVWTLPGPRYGNWVYERRDLLRESPGEPVPYRRQTRPGRIIEGQLIGVPFLPLKDYFRRPEMTPAQMNALPKAPLQRAYAALMLELDSPMPLYPLRITVGEPVVGVSNIACFNRFGHRLDYGTIEREVTVEGVQDVTCRVGWFPECKRIRVHLRFRFPWGPSVDVSEYLWLADGLGEVKRVEHITGWIWLFWMESAYEYSLVSFEPVTVPARTRPAASRILGGRAPDRQGAPDERIDWSRIAVTFDQVFPQPRVSGMYVELVDEGRDGIGRATREMRRRRAGQEPD
jgi:hypothetical protein